MLDREGRNAIAIGIVERCKMVGTNNYEKKGRE
jgi:hypothetical protein